MLAIDQRVWISTVTVLALLWGGCNRDPNSATRVPQATSEADSTRRWIDVEAIPGFGQDVFLARPRNLRFYDNDLFLVDDIEIKRLSLDGRLKNTIGAGRGEGPGEIQFITDYSVSGDDVWILDDHIRKVSRFDRRGTFKSSFRLPRAFIRILAHQDTLTIFQLVGQYPFRQYSYSGVELDSLGSFLSTQSDNPLALGGALAPAESGQIYFLPNMASTILTLGKTSATSFELVDRQPFPQMRDSAPPSGNVLLRAPTPPVFNSSLSVNGDTAWVSTVLRDDEERRDVFLDSYLLGSGRYVGSVRLPVNSRYAAVRGTNIYVSQDTLLVRYRIKR